MFDIKHRRYLDEINGKSVNQWYPLSRLVSDIEISIANSVKEINLVSELISNQELFDDFHFSVNVSTRPYNIIFTDSKLFGGVDSYLMSKEQIKKYTKEYLNDKNT